MNTEIWEPMVYRSKIGPARKLIYWPHEGCWQYAYNDATGETQSAGHFATAEDAALAAEGN